MLTLLHFKIDDQNYILDALYVNYILRKSELTITTIPNNCDMSILGWSKYQNTIYTIKDASHMIGGNGIDNGQSIILLNNDTGILVDSVSTVEMVEESRLKPSPIISKFVKKVLIDGDKLCLLLDT